MRRRVFIAVNLPDDIKNKLLGFRDKWPDLPARWTAKNNLHITLAFLGYLTDEEMLAVCNVTREVASRHKMHEIKLNKIIYGPNKKLPPRMVWIETEKSSELQSVKTDLAALLASKIKYALEERDFAPHITLARIKTWEWRKIEPEERPTINEEINLSFEAKSIEVIESRLKKGGAEYTILENAPLSK